jgi:hypothetical protein
MFNAPPPYGAAPYGASPYGAAPYGAQGEVQPCVISKDKHMSRVGQNRIYSPYMTIYKVKGVKGQTYTLRNSQHTHTHTQPPPTVDLVVQLPTPQLLLQLQTLTLRCHKLLMPLLLPTPMPSPRTEVCMCCVCTFACIVYGAQFCVQNCVCVCLSECTITKQSRTLTLETAVRFGYVVSTPCGKVGISRVIAS